MSLNEEMKDAVEKCSFLLKGKSDSEEFTQIIIPVRYIHPIDSPPKIFTMFENELVPFMEAYAKKYNKLIVFNSELAIKTYHCRETPIPEELFQPYADLIKDLMKKGLFIRRNWELIHND